MLGRRKPLGSTIQSKAAIRLELLAFFAVIVAAIIVCGPVVGTLISSGKFIPPQISLSLPQQPQVANGQGRNCTPTVSDLATDGQRMFVHTSRGLFEWSWSKQLWDFPATQTANPQKQENGVITLKQSDGSTMRFILKGETVFWEKSPGQETLTVFTKNLSC